MKPNLVEGVDYYYNERGLFVFTEKYHKDRGYCCANGCKHCPYTREEFNEARAKKMKSKLWW